jgi:hypothetical protein
MVKSVAPTIKNHIEADCLFGSTGVDLTCEFAAETENLGSTNDPGEPSKRRNLHLKYLSPPQEIDQIKQQHRQCNYTNKDPERA